MDNMWVLVVFSILSLAACDLFGGPSLTSTSPPWDDAIHSIQPGPLYGNTGLPYPTNVWWQNIVLNAGDLVNTVNPYMVKTYPEGLYVSLPLFYGGDQFYGMGFRDEVVMSAVEELGGHVVTAYDELSVTVNWDDGSLIAPIVRGMPYATVMYDSKTPNITFGAWGIASPSGELSGTRFEVTQNNNNKWILYTSSPVTFNVVGSSLVSTSPFSGTLRAAAVVAGSQVDVDLLDRCAEKIPIGGTVSAEVEGDIAIMQFNWETTGSGDLLMMALPHQLDTITNSKTVHTYDVLKGTMVGVTGEQWTFFEPLTTISWGASGDFPSDLEGDLKAALSNDIANTECCSDDPYFGGKQMAVFARLALMAEEIGETELANQAREKVRPFIEGWLGGTNNDTLLYDTTWGGVVSKNGMNDHNADFGNGMYNDHHFHYGYHIYTAAVLAKADPAWGVKWNDQVLHMISDVMEPSRDNQYYPFARTKDFYDGHSWASGIFSFGDGKNQESTSESVNGWYAIYLYGLATNNDRLTDLGRLFTALEIRAAWRYWQMTTDDSVFPESFSVHKTVGITWSTKVDYQTWFGANVEFIHCIQMLPFVPITEELLRENWISEAYPVLSEAYNRPYPPLSEGWKGYIIMAHAVIDPNAAYGEALQLETYDDGNTKSNTLYWIATRPGFDVDAPHPTPLPPTEGPGGCNCGGNPTMTDPNCLDTANDPWGGLGCDACNVPMCRYCGFGDFPPCDE